MKTLEDLIKDQFGALTVQVLMLTAENAQLKAALESRHKPEKKDS